jgi:hypothetical protein
VAAFTSTAEAKVPGAEAARTTQFRPPAVNVSAFAMSGVDTGSFVITNSARTFRRIASARAVWMAVN